MKTINTAAVLSFLAIHFLMSNEPAVKVQGVESAREKASIADSVVLENEYVRVLKNESAGSTLDTAQYGTRVIVALTNVKIQSDRGMFKLRRGEIAVFLQHESYQLPDGEYFEVAFKKNHPPLTAPEQWIEPEKNSVVYENNQFRVFEERLAPGDERQLHSHAPRVVVRLNPARLTDPRFHEKGTTKGSLQVPNTVKFAEPVVHVVSNVSEVPLFNIVIEFKIPH